MSDSTIPPPPPSTFPVDDFRATAAAFSQVAGVLGGFCITVLVLVLPPEFLKDNQAAKDWVVGIVLLAAFLYVASASFLANSMSSMVLTKLEARKGTFSFGIVLFHLGNLLIATALAILVYQFSATVGLVAIIAIIGLGGVVALVNFGIALGLFKPKG